MQGFLVLGIVGKPTGENLHTLAEIESQASQLVRSQGLQDSLIGGLP